MNETKNFSDENLKKYISSEILIIKKEKENKSNWKLNQEFNSQITIKVEEGEHNVS